MCIRDRIQIVILEAAVKKVYKFLVVPKYFSAQIDELAVVVGFSGSDDIFIFHKLYTS